MAEIAIRESITDNYVSNLIHLAWLSPDLVGRVRDVLWPVHGTVLRALAFYRTTEDVTSAGTAQHGGGVGTGGGGPGSACSKSSSSWTHAT